MMLEYHHDFNLQPSDNLRLSNLAGQFNQHLRQLEQRFAVTINNRGHQFRVTGAEQDTVDSVSQLLQDLYHLTAQERLDPERVHLLSQQANLEDETTQINDDDIVIRTRRGKISGRGANQQHYLSRIQRHDINFGIGPAGTGKTYLAVACAVEALEREEVRRLLLVRPAVEAGEKLGFLPGDLAQKVDPYLRPLFDALYDMMGVEKVAKLMERNVIEVAPLAYMRGRTLNEAFIILDEAQNTTCEQMKMFLTRIGFGSTAVITGDLTQVDLPRHTSSGLRHSSNILQDVEGISFTFFNSRDVVRHPLVARIIDAYERADEARD